jgi:hypothetical protein
MLYWFSGQSHLVVQSCDRAVTSAANRIALIFGEALYLRLLDLAVDTIGLIKLSNPRILCSTLSTYASL